MAFINKFNAVQVRIENNKPLQDFCKENFGKALKVITAFKHRKEIPLSDLPIILITRPYIRREIAGNVSKKEQNISIYAGFKMEDQARAIGLSIELEEMIEAAISVRSTHADDVPMVIMPADSATDEGKFHPVYFFGMDIVIKER